MPVDGRKAKKEDDQKWRNKMPYYFYVLLSDWEVRILHSPCKHFEMRLALNMPAQGQTQVQVSSIKKKGSFNC